jgi:hypothetical protein
MLKFNAVSDTSTFNIAAAMANREIVARRSIMAAVGLTNMKAPITLFDLDARLADSKLNNNQKLELKIAMSRAGLIEG